MTCQTKKPLIAGLEWNSRVMYSLCLCVHKKTKQDTWNMKGWHAKPKSPGYQVLNDMTGWWTVCVCVCIEKQKAGHLKHEGTTCQTNKPQLPFNKPNRYDRAGCSSLGSRHVPMLACHRLGVHGSLWLHLKDCLGWIGWFATITILLVQRKTKQFLSLTNI